jgi:FkbM family methyltransferase
MIGRTRVDVLWIIYQLSICMILFVVCLLFRLVMMDSSVTLNTNESMTIKSWSSSSLRSVSVQLNFLLIIVAIIFLLSSFRFVYNQERNVFGESEILPLTSTDASHLERNRQTKTYYDFEAFPINVSLEKVRNKTRRCFYIDVGCFDARDVDFFLHFHSQEISNYGELTVIAFEPDPINFSACKSFQQRHGKIATTVYDTAAWIDNGKIPYATEKGQRSRIDHQSSLFVRSIDFSQWLSEQFRPEDFIYVKFTIEGAEVPVLEKLINDGSLSLIDYLEIEWNDALSPDLEPRRVALECMFDNYGMDFLYMINPVDLRHAFNDKESFYSVPKDKGWYVSMAAVHFR